MHTRRTTAAGLLCFATLAAAAAARTAAAQTTSQPPARRGTATLTGVVTEAGSRAPVGNAGVAIVDPAGSVVAGMQTTAEGRFRVAGVPAGTYELRVRAVGRTPYTTPITFREGEQRTLDVTLSQTNVNLDAVVVSASRKPEKITDAPADIQLATPATIQSTAAVSVANAAKTLAGVDAFQEGAFSQTIVARGFNAIFGGVPYLVDYRPGALPGFGLPALHTMPQTSDDLQRMELVLGPASALYGPNFNAGVLQLITKSPFDDQGIQVSAQGGSRDFAKGQIRMATALGDHVAAKLSASILSLKEWPDDPGDPYYVQELAARQTYIKVGGDTTTFTGRTIGIRPLQTRRATVDGRVDVRPVEGLNVVVAGGYMKGTWLELTGLGNNYNDGAGYGYGQTRVTYGSLFAQAYRNFNTPGDGYRIPVGAPARDLSTQNGAQLQFSPTYGPLSLVVGGDYQANHPQSNQTVYGRYEADDKYSIAGAYAQGTYAVSPKLDLVASGRIDHHSRVDKALFSPRAAIVFKPASDQAFRFTYNRAFSTPQAINYFVDLPIASNPYGGGLGNLNLRLQSPPRGGFTFQYDAQGRPLWTTTLGPNSSAKPQLPLTTTDAASWAVIQRLITALSQGKINGSTLPLPGTQTPNGTLPAVPLTLATLNPAGGAPTPFTGPLLDVPSPQATSYNVVEVGYKGVLARKLFLTTSVYFSRTKGLIGTAQIISPNVFASGAALAQYLQALGVPAAQATALGTGIGQIPFGVVTPQQAFNRDNVILTTRQYPNPISVWGSDVSAEYAVSDAFRVMGNYSYVSRNQFLAIGGISTLNLYLNAPQNKFMFGTGYRSDALGVDAALRFRFVQGFPVRSATYVGDVHDYGLLDLDGSYRMPRARGARLTLQADNLLNNTTRQFVGVPRVGRFVALGLGYDFGGQTGR